MSEEVYLNVEEVFPNNEDLSFDTYDIAQLRQRFESRKLRNKLYLDTYDAPLSNTTLEFFVEVANLRQAKNIEHLGYEAQQNYGYS